MTNHAAGCEAPARPDGLGRRGVGRVGKRRYAALAVALVAFGWAGLVVGAPSIAGQPRPEEWPVMVATATYLVGGVVCHQQPARSFHLAGSQLPVCARCAGLYAAAPFGVLWAACGRRRRGTRSAVKEGRMSMFQAARVALLVVSIPTLLTWTAEQLGIAHPSNVVRAIAAIPLGFGAAGVVGLALVGAFDRTERPTE